MKSYETESKFRSGTEVRAARRARRERCLTAQRASEIYEALYSPAVRELMEREYTYDAIFGSAEWWDEIKAISF